MSDNQGIRELRDSIHNLVADKILFDIDPDNKNRYLERVNPEFIRELRRLLRETLKD